MIDNSSCGVQWPAEGVTPVPRPGIGMPLGRFDVIPSAVTGRPLQYFTPEPLPVLLERSLSACSGESLQPTPPVLRLLLARAASTDSAGNLDVKRAKRMAHVALGHTSYSNLDSILKLGAEISHLARKPRQEIVFSGASNASEALLVYTPHEALPALLSSLVEGLEHPPAGMDAVVLSAVVGFFCVHVHPFIDGNGRWARELSGQAGAIIGSPESGLISAIFQNRFKQVLAHSIWPSARRSGFKEYLELARSFEIALCSSIEPKAMESAEFALSTLKRHFVSRRDYEEAAITVFACGTDDPGLLRGKLNLSAKRYRWLIEELNEIAGSIGPAVSSDNFFAYIAGTIIRAIECAQDSVKRSMK